MRKQINIILIAISVFLLLVGIVGCDTPGTTGKPLLPAGFENNLVPDVEMDAYIYFNHSTPVTIPSNVITGLNTPVALESITIWGGTDVHSMGIAATLSDETTAPSILNQFKLVKGLWSAAKGKVIYLSPNTSDWNTSLQSALGRNLVPLGDKYASVQEVFKYFPSQPPAPPVLAGFLKADGKLAASAISEGLDLSEMTQALQAIKISTVNFVFYGQLPSPLSQKDISIDLIQRFGVLIVGRSDYPSVALSLLFDKVVQDAGAVKITTGDKDIYSFQSANPAILIGRNGSIIYMAIANTRDTAEKLLLSALP